LGWGVSFPTPGGRAAMCEPAGLPLLAESAMRVEGDGSPCQITDHTFMLGGDVASVATT
jgi:hypothetical protein